jgi:DNA-binding transcriptional ArsR family regulator
VDVVLNALAQPHRRDILRLIQEQEMAAGQIASHFDVSGPAISQHLKVLREAGLVTVRRDGARRLYRARPEGLSEVRGFLEGFWTESLRQLKQAVEDEERRRLARDN